MRDPSFYVSSLLELGTASAQDRRVLWRQAMAALSRTSSEDGPGPLEALHPDVLLKGAHAALESGLADDLDWLAPSAAGVALYTLAAALPASSEQRELGRRVLARMLAGDAHTFTAIATRMAQSSSRGLSSPQIRARVALVTELPLGHAVADGPLALALVTRRDHARDWVVQASTRSLAQRRLAAKIIERAAREAARRAQTGDPHAFRALLVETVRESSGRLLSDRESLVWRYVAIARGLAAPWVEELRTQLVEGLKEGLSPTEWRRAAASLAAYAAVRPEDALKLTQAALKRGLFTSDDPPSAAAFVWGISRTIEAEPEVATKLLDMVLGVASPEVAESVVELKYEVGVAKATGRAARQAAELVKRTRERRDRERDEDDGADALFGALARELDPASADDILLRDQVVAALETFASESALSAYAKARDVLSAARGAMDALEAVAKDDDAEGGTGTLARRTSMTVLRDLDTSLLERHVIADLVKLGGSQEQMRASEDALDAIRERFAEWIVACESPEEMAAESWESEPKHATLRLRRLRALLHLVDGDLGESLEAVGRDAPDVQRARRLRALWLRTIRALLEHFEQDPTPVLKRTLLAALARALDALVRVGVCDVADALLVLATRIRIREDFETLAEASMDPDLRHVLGRYARFLRANDSDLLAALPELANDLAAEGSARSESLRTVLLRLHTSLTAVASARSLGDLSSTRTVDADLVSNVETWTFGLAQMCAGARGRLDPETPALGLATMQPKLLGVAVSRVLAGVAPALTEEALGSAIDELTFGIPYGIATVVAKVAAGLARPPSGRANSLVLDLAPVSIAEPLPPWLPARRTIGGFYVHRSLGVGGTASVFIVTRLEDRSEPNAERLALKVPDYNATAARSVSQEEFFKLFREEASALIMLPGHVNLARFVTFDMGARPLPILVMELVEGITLERVLDTRTFDMKKCLKAMDDVLAGLEAMHSVGIGHLDLKPSNVVLRRGEQGVLVDFGLAGRKIRQGCGTGPYGAPEVWGVVPDNHVPYPPAADIYAFGCLAFEMLTGKILFDAPNEVAQITMHITHDGKPLPLQSLVANPEVGPLAEILVPTLRRDPRQRPSAERLREDLRSVAPMLSDATWPALLGGNR